MTTPLLSVTDLQVVLRTARGPAVAVRDLGFTLERGDTLGLVGESGCGKSLTALALMGLLPEGAQVSGSIRLNGRELVGLPEREMAGLRGDRIAMVFQEPMTALNPVHTVARQVAEPLRLHKGLNAAQARAEAIALLDRVGIPDAARRADAYPHQFSGGQRQRIAIARALAMKPDVLVCDEPVASLDVSIQAQIINLFLDLRRDLGLTCLFISHDLSVVRHVSHRVAIMYLGRVVEVGRAEDIYNAPKHPYTRALLDSVPKLVLQSEALVEFKTIAGELPSPLSPPPGCAFSPRCPLATARCRSDRPALLAYPDGRSWACHEVLS